jgi:hypothetical protein
MFTLKCTKKLLDRIKPQVESPRAGTTLLGDWYATVLFWKPQVALIVNERTLLPVLVPLAPASTLVQRFPLALKDVLGTLGLPAAFVEAEIRDMREVTYAKTSNRSVLGVMNEFAFLAAGYRAQSDAVDALSLSLTLAGTPCGPLYKTTVFPDRAVRELVFSGGIN